MDKKLRGHVIWTDSVFSELQCDDICLRVPGCLAYNYQYRGEGGQHSCELMNDVSTEVEDMSGYSFRLFERERTVKVGNCQYL